MKLLHLLLGLLPLSAVLAQSAPVVDAMRGSAPIPQEPRPPLLRNAINDDQRPQRDHPMQPPIIPHRVDGYQVTRDFNKCMDCHAAERSAFSQAVPVSATHYLDRNGRRLDRISTRRYFCQQCHVAQDPVQPLVGNSFQRRSDAWPAPPAPGKNREE